MTTAVFLIMVIIVITAGYLSVCAICLRRKAPGFYTICFDNSFYDFFCGILLWCQNWFDIVLVFLE